MVEIMDAEIDVTEPHHGSANVGVRRLWRRNRNAAYRQAYKETSGKTHPASKSGQPKKDLEILLQKTEPPYGMSWQDFGVLWDLHPEHPYTPVLRSRSVESEWQIKLSDPWQIKLSDAVYIEVEDGEPKALGPDEASD